MDVEISQIILNGGLAFLAFCTGISIVALSVYLISLIINLTTLVKSLDKTSNMLNAELKPTLKNVNEAVNSINTLIQSTDRGVGNVRNSIGTAFNKTKAFSEGILGGFLKGFLTVYTLFKKK